MPDVESTAGVLIVDGRSFYAASAERPAVCLNNSLDGISDR